MSVIIISTEFMKIRIMITMSFLVNMMWLTTVVPMIKMTKSVSITATTLQPKIKKNQ